MKIENNQIRIRDFTWGDLPLMLKWLTDDRGVFAMDQFIGEPDYWNRGIGSVFLENDGFVSENK